MFYLSGWERAWFVYFPMNHEPKSRLSMSLSLLPPCIICRVSHLVIWEKLTDREESLAFNYTSATSGTKRHTPRQAKTNKIYQYTLQYYQSHWESLHVKIINLPPPLSCAHKCLIWISLAPLPSNCLGPGSRQLSLVFRRSGNTRGIKHIKRDCAQGTED